jgi:hypothetical protein
MKAYRGMDVYTHVFLTSPLVGAQWSALRPGDPPPPSTHLIGGWVDLRAYLDDSENCLPHWDSNSELLVVQPVARRYTDCAIPAHSKKFHGT